MCSFPSQSVVTLYLSSSSTLRCMEWYLPNILHQNHRQPRWSLLDDFRGSIVLGYCLRYVIHIMPGVGQVHHVLFILLVGVQTSHWLPVQRCINCAPCHWYCIYLWIIVGSWISVSLCILLYPCNYLGKIFDVHVHVSRFYFVDGAVYMQFRCG